VDDEGHSSTVDDGCLLLAIGAATGAAAVLTLAIILATIACIYHRQPSFANKRVSTALAVDILFSRFSSPHVTTIKTTRE